MKDLYQVLRQKEMDIARVRKEIKALHRVISLLADDPAQPWSTTRGSSLAPEHKQVTTGAGITRCDDGNHREDPP